MTAENPLEPRHRNHADRYERGLGTANELAGHEAVQRFLGDLEPISGSTARLVIETVFGTLHHEPGLDHRERELVTLTALAVLGDKPLPYGVEDSILNMKVIDAIFESEKTGAWAKV